MEVKDLIPKNQCQNKFILNEMSKHFLFFKNLSSRLSLPTFVKLTASDLNESFRFFSRTVLNRIINNPPSPKIDYMSILDQQMASEMI